MHLILKYFPELTALQQKQFEQLEELYRFWNTRINVISRKDMDELYLHHVLHSLSVARLISFVPGTKILDVGTGGGFPGIPLSILFPESSFLLIDSIGKKVRVVNNIASSLGLKNCSGKQIRAEILKGKFDFIISRAVTKLPVFLQWVKDKIEIKGKNSLPNGIIYLKGGDLEEEIHSIRNSVKIYSVSDYFDEQFFETKKIVYISNSL
jgi:16S rRNA (guanine527-N7)-methyltransferase